MKKSILGMFVLVFGFAASASASIDPKASTGQISRSQMSAVANRCGDYKMKQLPSEAPSSTQKRPGAGVAVR